MRNNNLVKKITITAFLLALSSVLHYLEGFIPMPVPGFRLGLAILPCLFALLYLGPSYYVIVSLLKVILVALFQGFGTSFLLSIVGTSLSVIITFVLYQFTKSSIYTISILGSYFHVLGQIIMYVVIIKNPYMFLYFPVLSIVGIGSGLVIALIVSQLIKRIPQLNRLKAN